MGYAGGEQHIKKAPCYRALLLLIYPAPAARISGCFAFTFEAKSASDVKAPTPCDSERAASAFSY
ncbi:hypothetical protein CMV37_07525 [Bacillus cereus]|uniref:Uncharacterized protein n=1 Tax=Bacillus cereus (strain ATCC 10987 / NRS 248) TaxID=222523 RepID=Q72XW8_BACC1|nr:hypothetical protein BCE_5255 [Bacillus cereus ATCC 10987]KMQ29015.1 hypothetical protein TU53_21740 [Bacillus cereus]KXY68618.1 hypothetical protein AT272_17645 [Bacillus cereus]OBZ61097.1 hypothetical protein UN66_00455 [Bacillus cereus]PDM38125.1 hypothetical protein CMV37_07525 [Bacillus cereus]